MNANLRYEVKAEAYLLMTGRLAPGKDSRGHEDLEERQLKWDEWWAKHGTAINAALDAFDRVMVNEPLK